MLILEVLNPKSICMKYLFITLLIIPVLSFSQNRVSIIRDTTFKIAAREWPHYKDPKLAVFLSDGELITNLSIFKLGKGTLPNGDYNYIATASNSMEAKLKAGTLLKEIKVSEIRKRGNKKYGFKYIFRAEGKYLIQLEDAIASGEIILPAQ